jgi:hypothetical protein
VFAKHLPVGIEFITPFFAVLTDDGFEVRAIFLPANYRSAFELFVGSLLHGLRHVRAIDAFFFFLVSVSVRGSTEGESSADRDDRD